jgi:hypothetical protein
VWGKGSISLYRDGVLLQTVDLKTYTFAATPGPLHLGRSYSSLGIATSPVEVSELRVWKTARRAEDLLAHNIARLSGTERDLVAYYRFDLPQPGGRARDYALGLDGTLSSAQTVSSNLNLYQGLQLAPGALLQFLGMPCVGSANFTVSVTLRVRNVPTGTQRVCFFATPNGRLNCILQPHELPGLLANTFVTLTQVLDGGTRRTYLNDVLVQTIEVGTSNIRSTEPLMVNAAALGTNNSILFNGEVAEVCVWSDSRTETWIKDNDRRLRVGNEAGLVALFRPALVQGTALNAVNNPAVNGFLVYPDFSYTFQPSGIRFSAPNQYGHIPKSDKFNLPKYAICFWFRPDAAFASDGSSAVNPLRFDTSPRVAWQNGTLFHRWYDTQDQFINWGVPTTMELGKWYYVCLTNDGKVATVWVDGVKVGENVHNRGVKSAASGIILGRRDTDTTIADFKGCIDELSIFDWTLNVNLIKSIRYQPPVRGLQGLVAHYSLRSQDGDQIRDTGSNALHGKLYNMSTGQNLPATPLATATERMAMQALGHTRLRIGGHEVMRADMRMNDNEFWFKGKLNLFPSSWGVKIAGEAEGLIQKDKLYLNATTSVNLHGLQLIESRTLITHERAVLSGKWLGLETLLDIQWAGGDPRFKGYAGTTFKRTFELGAIYIEGIKVADNFRITLDVDVHFGFDFDKTGFACDARCKFKINGVGFDESFALKVPMSSIEELATLLRQALIDAPKKFFAHVFASALAYLQSLYNAVVEWWSNAEAQAAAALQNVYQQTVTALAQVAQQLQLPPNFVSSLLLNGYQESLTGIGDALTGAGYTTVQVASGLIQGAMATMTQVIQYFKAKGGSAGDLTSAFVSLGYNLVEIARGLRDAGYQVAAIANGINPWLSVRQTLAKVLNEAAFNIQNIALALKAVGLDATQAIGDMLGAGLDINLVYATLRDVGYASASIANGLRLNGFSLDQSANIFLATTVTEARYLVVGFLRSGFGDQADAIANAIKGISSDTFARGFGGWLDNLDIAKQLKRCGYSALEATQAMRYGLNLAESAARAVLLNAQYAASQVANAITSVYR